MAELRYRPVVRAGDLIAVSGQLGVVDGQLLDGFHAQAAHARLLEPR